VKTDPVKEGTRESHLHYLRGYGGKVHCTCGGWRHGSRISFEEHRVESVLGAAGLPALARWKQEATAVLEGWERVYEALGSPGPLGSSKAESALAEVERLRGLLRKRGALSLADTILTLTTERDAARVAELEAEVVRCERCPIPTDRACRLNCPEHAQHADDAPHVHLWTVASWRSDFPNRGGVATLTCDCRTTVDVTPADGASLDLNEARAEVARLRAQVARMTGPEAVEAVAQALPLSVRTDDRRLATAAVRAIAEAGGAS
jgi:hypothetical protein